MLRRLTPIAGLLLALWCSACLVGFVWTLDYDFETAARCEDDAGETPLAAGNRGRATDLVTGDDRASFSVDVHPGGIDVSVRNLASTPLRLRLERARFIHPDGRESPLYAAGPGNEGEAPAVAPPGSEVRVFLWPREWLRGHSGERGSTWRSDSPVDGALIAESSRAQAEALGRPHLGLRFEIVLPVESNGSKRSYRFQFTVRDIAPKRISWA